MNNEKPGYKFKKAHADHYLKVLIESEKFYRQGGNESSEGLAILGREMGQIARAQDWCAQGAHNDIIRARLCSDFCNQAQHILDCYMQPEELKRWNWQGLKAARTLDDYFSYSEHISQLANAALGQGKSYKAVRLLKTALELIPLAQKPETEHLKSKAYILCSLGVAYSEVNQPGEARKVLDNALKIGNELSDDLAKQVAYINLAHIYHHDLDFQQAEFYLNKSLHLSEATGDLSGQSVALTSLANVFWDCYEEDSAMLEKAINYLEKALGFARKLGDSNLQSEIICSLSKCHWQMSNCEIAWDLGVEAIVIVNQLGNLRIRVDAQMNLANIALDKRENDVAKALLEEVVSTGKHIRYDITVVNGLYNLALLADVNKQKELALEYISQALNICNTHDSDCGFDEVKEEINKLIKKITESIE
ncbi:hypothetical protein [Photobacterium sp. OFAV2-7]|uniref:hypothetical protein n=1 Tax=Photobacterium sp. OFAV2-7 TaxID=2917748 RepID=UPI001EF69A83|nr:hypothetical protein [Photobacterium sp. OFAV2-7]MCG7585652.1 hypothetical protein [Photobacterium sp. OFAV2-7]